MNELDQLIEEQTPEVAKAINDLIDRAGTSDSDCDVLLAAGNMIAELSAVKSEYADLSGILSSLLYHDDRGRGVLFDECLRLIEKNLISRDFYVPHEKLSPIDDDASYEGKEFNLMVERGTKAWEDVQDAKIWIEELKGEEI